MSEPTSAPNQSQRPPTPRPGTGFFAVEDKGVVFSELSQTLFALDALAAFCWLELTAGRGVDDIVRDLAAAGGDDRESARPRVDGALESFAAADLLDDGRPPQPPAPPDQPDLAVTPPEGLDALLATPAATVHLAAMEKVLRLDFGTARLAELYRPMVAALETAATERPDHHLAFVIDDRVAYGCMDGVAVYSSVGEGTPAATLERLVWRGALTGVDYLLSVHCGAVGIGQGAVAATHPAAWLSLPAASGSGKTTLTAALTAAGYPYGSDELIVLRPDLEGRPFPFPLCVKTKSWDVLAPRYPDLSELPVYRRFRHRVRYLPPATPLAMPDWRPIAAFVFPRYAADGATTLTPLDPVAGMQRLFDQCLTIPEPLTLTDVGRLVDLARRVPFYELPLSDLDAAIGAIDELVATLDP